MTDEQLLRRIVINQKVMVGKPVIKGTRLTVEYVVDRLAHGASIDELLAEYEGLIADDILACLLFAKKSLAETDNDPADELIAQNPEFQASIQRAIEHKAAGKTKSLAEMREKYAQGR